MAAQRKRSSSKKTGKSIVLALPLAITVRILIVILFFFLTRVLFWLFNLHYFSDLAAGSLFRIFMKGLLFDISAVMAINLPLIILYYIPFRFRYKPFYIRTVNVLFYAVNIFGMMINLIDTVYFRFTLKRLTSDIFKYLGVGGDFNALVPQFLKDFWPLLVAWIVLSAAFVWVCTRIVADISAGKGKGREPGWYFLQSFWFILAVAIAITGIRGGVSRHAIDLRTPARYASVKYIPLLINTPYSLITSFRLDPVKEQNRFKSEKELATVYTPFHAGSNDTLTPLNVMVIILESFSREHIGALNRDLENGTYEGYTPFIDSLIGQSMVFPAFANGKTSIQGVPAILSGIPALMDQPFLQSRFEADRITGLGGLLKPYGYTTAFFHGGTNGIMSFDTYMPRIGFDHYYGRKEYGNEKDYDGKWGIHDEEFMQFMAKKVGEMPKPFAVAFFSLSSHHPYTLPGKYKHQFGKGNLPIQQVVRYTDFSLARFFHTIRHESWFYNTLFVITADHCSEGYYPYYNTHVGQYAIPLIFYKPGSDLKGSSTTVAQQADVLPSVLGYLGYDKPYIAFGNDLFDTSSKGFSMSYLGGIYTLIMDGYSLEFDGTRTTALFDLKSDPLQQHNLAGKGRKAQDQLELFMRAYLQQYNNRMIENRLMVQ